MCQVAINTCICNATHSNIDHSGFWIENVSWNSSNAIFTCLGRSNRTHRMICSHRRLTEAGLNINVLILILICIIIALLVLLVLLLRKLQEYKELLDKRKENLEEIKRKPKAIFVITLEGKHTSNQVLS